MTRDFTQYVHVGSHDGRKITLTLGPGATDAVADLLSGSFDSVAVESVAGDAGVYSAIQGQKDSTAFWDYVAVPKFVDPASYVVPFTTGFNLILRVDFVSLRPGHDGVSIEGSGNGKANIWLSSAIRGMGEEALRGAVKAMRDDLETKRMAFE